MWFRNQQGFKQLIHRLWGSHALLSRLLPSLSNGCVCTHTPLWFFKLKVYQSFHCPAQHTLYHFLFQSVNFTPESACSVKSECLQIVVFRPEFITIKFNRSSLGHSQRENLRPPPHFSLFLTMLWVMNSEKALPNLCDIGWAHKETRQDLFPRGFSHT